MDRTWLNLVERDFITCWTIARWKFWCRAPHGALAKSSHIVPLKWRESCYMLQDKFKLSHQDQGLRSFSCSSFSKQFVIPNTSENWAVFNYQSTPRLWTSGINFTQFTKNFTSEASEVQGNKWITYSPSPQSVTWFYYIITWIIRMRWGNWY